MALKEVTSVLSKDPSLARRLFKLRGKSIGDEPPHSHSREDLGGENYGYVKDFGPSHLAEWLNETTSFSVDVEDLSNAKEWREHPKQMSAYQDELGQPTQQGPGWSWQAKMHFVVWVGEDDHCKGLENIRSEIKDTVAKLEKAQLDQQARDQLNCASNKECLEAGTKIGHILGLDEHSSDRQKKPVNAVDYGNSASHAAKKGENAK